MTKKEMIPPVSVIKTDIGITEIHVEGSMLPNAVYLEILAIIKEVGLFSRKIFVVKTPAMIQLIHMCIPREYYENIVLEVNHNGEELRRYAS